MIKKKHKGVHRTCPYMKKTKTIQKQNYELQNENWRHAELTAFQIGLAYYIYIDSTMTASFLWRETGFRLPLDCSCRGWCYNYIIIVVREEMIREVIK